MLSSTFWIRPSPPGASCIKSVFQEEEGNVLDIKSVFQQPNRKQVEKEQLEKLNLERQKLLDEVNAPLKRKVDIVEAEMPDPKRARKEPGEKKSKPKLQKPKPAPKYKQQKMSNFFKKNWDI